ncbi:MAG: aldose 1-epimerase family protein [Bacteroidota bacterium]
MHYIQSENIRVGIKQQGAELASIKSLLTGQEYLWEADSAYWGRHSSILFPIVGRLKNDQFLMDGKPYSMKQHGFARNTEFEVLDAAKDRICFQLLYTAEDLKKYPFQYELQAEYRLEGSQLRVIYRVFNHDQRPMYFSLGAHPAFKCPLKAGEKRSDYHLIFEQVENAHRHLIENGLRTGETAMVLDQERILPIIDDLFEQDALIFKDLNSDVVSLAHKDGKKVLDFDFSGFPYLGIWSKDETSPFVCLEPWFGVADHVGDSGNLEQKTGIIELGVEQSFECEHGVRVYN